MEHSNPKRHSRTQPRPRKARRQWPATAHRVALPVLATTLVAPLLLAASGSSSAEALKPEFDVQPRVASTVAEARAELPAARSAARRSPSKSAAKAIARSRAGARSGSAPSRAPASGIAPSAYTGRYYSPAYEGFRRCIVHRESRGDYTARNPRSSAAGAYQFLLSTSNVVARMMDRPDLVGRSASTWPRAAQDEAFYVLYDHGRGVSHWGYSCG